MPKLSKPIAPAIWEALGFPPGWGEFQPDIGERVHFVIALPNGIPAEALIAERVGSPGFVGRASTGPVAGQNSYVRLFNPIGTGQELLLDTFFLARGAGFGSENFSIRTGAAAGAGAVNPANKQIGGAASVAELLTGDSAAVGGTTLATLQPSGLVSGLRLDDPFVIGPGVDVSIVCETVNFAFVATLMFRQRAI